MATPLMRYVICVVEAFRGTGFGDELLTQTASRARRADYVEHTLKVDADNDWARASYDRYGFEPVQYMLAVSIDELSARLKRCSRQIAIMESEISQPKRNGEPEGDDHDAEPGLEIER